jgi:hypothetical protein
VPRFLVFGISDSEIGWMTPSLASGATSVEAG